MVKSSVYGMLIGVLIACGGIRSAASFAQSIDGRNVSERYGNRIFTIHSFLGTRDQSGAESRICNIGTAFSFGADSYLVTLESVVEGAERITAVSSTGTAYDATLLDSNGSVSVLKIENALSPLLSPIEPTDTPHPGQEVLVLSLHESQITTSPGIIDSVRQRDGTLFIQAQPGRATSGTPVFDAEAGLVGLLAVRIEPSAPEPADLPARSFLVFPADYVWMLAQSIINCHDRTCGWLGISSDILSNTGSDGVVVRNIIPESPAEKSGIRIDDRIVWFNNEEVVSFRHLIEHLSATKPGETATVGVRRGSEQLTIPVTLVPYPPDE